MRGSHVLHQAAGLDLLAIAVDPHRHDIAGDEPLRHFVAALLRRRPVRPFALQVVGAWREPGAPGLRERAEAFNRALPPA